MANRPNILFLMTDQMQGRVLDPDHPCQTPTLDALAARGVHITQAYTTNAVCSPARASLMTGLLPHTHGVIQVTHCQPPHLVALDRNRPHWAQHLRDAGYRTGYFGKWHVESSESPGDFGWEYDASNRSEQWKAFYSAQEAHLPEAKVIQERRLLGIEGYTDQHFYAVHDRKPEHRGCGLHTSHALQWLDDVIGGEDPWCCFVSVQEPHDPFVVGREAYERYDVDALPVPKNWHDDLAGRPGLYRKCARVFEGMSLKERKEAAACYYGMITEIDSQFARLLDRLKQADQIDNTIIVFTSDHGEFLGAHGLYDKNVSAYEEAYNIPMIVAGPGVAQHGAVNARVGLHDLGSTLIDLVGLNNFQTPESRSFMPLLRDPEGQQDQYTTGYAEYYGTRYWYSQRIYWDGPWKLVWNGFDFDELYNLDDDPGELQNLIEAPEHADRVRAMMADIWRIVRETDDQSLYRSNYPALRLAPYGPGVEAEHMTTASGTGAASTGPPPAQP